MPAEKHARGSATKSAGLGELMLAGISCAAVGVGIALHRQVKSLKIEQQTLYEEHQDLKGTFV